MNLFYRSLCSEPCRSPSLFLASSLVEIWSIASWWFSADLGARFGDFAPLGDLTGLGYFAALGRPFFTAPLSVKELHIRYQT